MSSVVFKFPFPSALVAATNCKFKLLLRIESDVLPPPAAPLLLLILLKLLLLTTGCNVPPPPKPVPFRL